MAVDMFLKIAGEIAGEAQDSAHKGEIDVLAWSWGLSNSGSFHVGGGGGSAMDIGNIIGNVAGSGVGGGGLLAIIGLIKNAMAKG